MIIAELSNEAIMISAYSLLFVVYLGYIGSIIAGKLDEIIKIFKDWLDDK